jgi:hypothetical protein
VQADLAGDDASSCYANIAAFWHRTIIKPPEPAHPVPAGADNDVALVTALERIELPSGSYR